MVYARVRQLALLRSIVLRLRVGPQLWLRSSFLALPLAIAEEEDKPEVLGNGFGKLTLFRPKH